MIWLIGLALFAGAFPTMAQNSFPTPGGASVRGVVLMCYTAGTAKPCSGTVTGPDATFTTPGGSTVGGVVQMCIVANQAVPC
jgi:hypothetical protein